MPKILSARERWLVGGLIFIILFSVFSLAIKGYLNRTQVKADLGGQYQEGIIGQPHYFNPVLAQANDADRDIVQIVFSGLLKYDGQGNLIPDLAQNYEIKENGLVYDFFLKKDIKWHDKEPLTADDIIFTIKTIQDQDYKSPLKTNWGGVEVEKIDDLTVRFKLKNIYAPFLHSFTVGILPKHLWAGISPQNFHLAEYNLKPIGSGPYKFKKITKNKAGAVQSLELERNKDFYGLKENESAPRKGPYLKKLIFRFYPNEEEGIKALNKKQVDGISLLSASQEQTLRRRDLTIYQITLPQYYAVFFNQSQSKVLADKTVRLALSYATDKKEIIERVFKGKASAVDSPFLPGSPGYTSQTKIYDFALEHAKNILEAEDWKDSDNDGIREKKISGPGSTAEETKLEINLITTEWPGLKETAELLKTQWEKIGVKVNLEIVSFKTIEEEHIKPRQYQALLFGEVLGADPDPFAFWHSSQKKDPGLNLALYNSKQADKLLEDGRQTLDPAIRAQKYEEFQKLVVEDAPVIFLYSPTYLYRVIGKIKGINLERLALPSYRFSQIENWYINTDRVWK